MADEKAPKSGTVPWRDLTGPDAPQLPDFYAAVVAGRHRRIRRVNMGGAGHRPVRPVRAPCRTRVIPFAMGSPQQQGFQALLTRGLAVGPRLDTVLGEQRRREWRT
jgi:hypothetical protein